MSGLIFVSVWLGYAPKKSKHHLAAGGINHEINQARIISFIQSNLAVNCLSAPPCPLGPQHKGLISKWKIFVRLQKTTLRDVSDFKEYGELAFYHVRWILTGVLITVSRHTKRDQIKFPSLVWFGKRDKQRREKYIEAIFFAITLFRLSDLRWPLKGLFCHRFMLQSLESFLDDQVFCDRIAKFNLCWANLSPFSISGIKFAVRKISSVFAQYIVITFFAFKVGLSGNFGFLFTKRLPS